MTRRFLLALPALFSLAGTAHAIDYRAAKEAAILRDAPSEKGGKLFVILRGTPVELVLTSGDWSKVRDGGGNLAWIESRLLAMERTVIVRAPKAQARVAADEKSSLVFEAERDVVLDLMGPPRDGWAQVKHAGGATGFVRVAQVWGL